MISKNTHSLTVLTGASKGMGLAIARQLLTPGDTLLCISRTSSDALAVDAEKAGTTLVQWTHDLADAASSSLQLEQWLAGQSKHAWASVTLINNAGMIPPIAPLGAIKAAEIARALRVGLEAPMQLSSAFLRATENWRTPRKVLNISSGLGRRAMASQAGYCAAKAGMDHFSRCVALEEALKPNGASVCSLAPGVIDTGMQEQLRSADSNAFPDQASFLNLKTSGSLSSPEDAAKRILAFLARTDFGSNPVADIRD